MERVIEGERSTRNADRTQDDENDLARSFASMVEYQGDLYVFGGKNKFFRNDVWKFCQGNLLPSF